MRENQAPQPVAKITRAWPAADLLGASIAFEKRTVVVKSGTEVRTLYLIEEGVVGRFMPGSGGDILDGVRTSGWLIGAAPAIAGGRFEATIKAMTNCRLRPLPIALFRKAMQCPAVSAWLNELLAADVQAHAARGAAVATRAIHSLVEELFLELMLAAGRTGRDGCIRLMLELSVVDVANLVGASREHTSRVLGDLDAVGTLTKVGGWFVAPARSPLVARIRGATQAV